MKRFLVTLFAVAIVVITIISIFMISEKDNTVWTTNNEYLYDKAINYIIKELVSKNKKETNKIFTDYKGFGIEEKDNKKYAYMWILEEEYYVENEEIYHDGGSSMFYKFTFENDEVVNYETPKDGSLYTDSLNKLLPDSIKEEVAKFSENNSLDLTEEIEKWEKSLK